VISFAYRFAHVPFHATTSRRRPVELAFSGHARGRPPRAPTSLRQHCCRTLTPSQREWACARKYAPPALTNEAGCGGNFPSSEATPRRVGGSGVRAQAHSRFDWAGKPNTVLTPANYARCDAPPRAWPENGYPGRRPCPDAGMSLAREHRPGRGPAHSRHGFAYSSTHLDGDPQ
jgi:hypothetical protein